MLRLLQTGLLALLVAEGLVFLLTLPILGFGRIFLLWVLSAFAGGWLIRAHGLALLSGLAGLGSPRDLNLAGGLRFVLAGFLLFFPGFISDLAALALLVQPSLRTLRSGDNRKDAPPFKNGVWPNDGAPPPPGHFTRPQDIIDADYTEIRDDKDRAPR